MTKTGSKTLKVISATAMCVFSLLCAFMGAFAWFVSKMNEDADADQFAVNKVESAITSVAVHDFYGVCDDGVTLGFNPVANHSITWEEREGSDTVGFTMGTYSVDNPHHPVLLLMEVNGSLANLSLKTEYPYILGTAPTPVQATFATYAALNVAANKVEGNDGKYFEVTNDEHQTAYYTEEGVNKRVTTRYKYNHADQSFEFVSTNLGQSDNPLSSVIKSNYVLYSDNPTDNAGTYQTTTGYFRASGRAVSGITYYTRVKDGNSYVYTEDDEISIGNELGGNHFVNRTYVPINSNFSTPTASFVTFSGSTYNYSKKATLFQGSTAGNTHLAIILDYNSPSLEYLYSVYLGHPFLKTALSFKCDWSMDIA